MPASIDVLSAEERLAAFVTTRNALSRRRFVTAASFVNLVFVPAMLTGFVTYGLLAVFAPGRYQMTGAVGVWALVCVSGYRWATTAGATRVSEHQSGVAACNIELDTLTSSTFDVPAESVVRHAVELGRYLQSLEAAERIMERSQIGPAATVCRSSFNVIGFQRMTDDSRTQIADLAVCFLDPLYARVLVAVGTGWEQIDKPASSFSAYTNNGNSTLTKACVALDIADALSACPGADDVFFTLLDDAGGSASQSELAEFAAIATAVVA